MKKTKGIKPRIFYVQKLFNDNWITIATEPTFQDAQMQINCMRHTDRECNILNFYRVVICKLTTMDIIDFD